MNNINYSNIRPTDDDQLLLDEQKETILTDVTYPKVTNEEFLEGIFGNIEGDQRPLLCAFTGHPGKGSSGKWVASPWLPGKTSFDAMANNYFTLATFKPDSEGKYRRQKKTYAAQYALMLDDIGTKVKVKELRLPLPPSWIIETSPGNFQAGYILRELKVDGAVVECLMKTIISVGLCDPGADGPLARCARLPVGVNGKHDPPFKCRLIEWRPKRRYTIQEIVDGLELDFSSTLTLGKRHGIGTLNSPPPPGVDDRIYIPRSLEHPVITRLKEKNLYLQPLGNGKHEIICPWQHEHTDGVGGGTAYFEPTEEFQTGGFVCLHAHCKKRRMRDLREYLGVSITEAANRPTIRLREGCLNTILDHFEQELARLGCYYQRAGVPVYICSDPSTRESTIRPLSVYSMVRVLSRFVNFERFDRRRNQWIAYDPPYSHCRNLCESENYPHLPVLHGLAKQPYLRPDESLMTEPGYDQATGLYGMFDKGRFAIPDTPSRHEAEGALAIINSLLDEFNFEKLSDRSAALSAILTAAIRLSLALAPMYLLRAPQISSGKSYLAALIAAFATASVASGVSFPANEEECRKLLLASLMTAPSVVSFDNLTTDLLPFKTLCTVLTDESFTDRILGGSKTATVPTRILFLASGNNVWAIRDMSRRTVTINLDPACEIPAARTFNKEPLSMVRSQREYYVSLALTVIRGWIVAGRPITDVTPISSYTAWSDLCRQPLLWLGYPDPAESIFASMKQDPDRETLGRLLHAWYACFNTRPKMIREAICRAGNELIEVFMDIAGDYDKLNNKRLGKWISRHANRIVDGLKFEKDSSTRSAEAWRVVSV